jgi:hypothetical protein
MVYQDTHIQQVANFPNHAKDSYITRIFNKSRKIFAAAVSEGLSMNFVQVLMRGGKFGDENLPLPNDTKPRDENNKVWPKEDTKKFLEAQKLVCAPFSPSPSSISMSISVLRYRLLRLSSVKTGRVMMFSSITTTFGGTLPVSQVLALTATDLS